MGLSQKTRLFFTVAILNVFGLGLSLSISHILGQNYKALVQENAKLESFRTRVSQLQRLANNADLPGNDIFHSKDLPHEKERLNQIIEEFNTTFNEFKKDSNQMPLNDLSEPITQIQTLFNELVSEANQVFQNFEHNIFKAQSHMASMDKKNAEINEEFSKIRSIISSAQNDTLSLHQANYTRLSHWNHLIAVLSMSIVSFLCYQGLITMRRIQRQALEEKKLLEEIKIKNSELKKTFKLYSSLDQIINRYAIISKTDLAGNITYVNDNFVRISGYSREEILGKNYRFLKSSEHKPEFYKNIWSAITTGQIWHGEIKNKKKNGEFYWVDSTIGPIFDENGKITEYMSIRHDITEKKFNELQLFQAQKLESIGKLSAGIAHDFNNILGGILGYASILKEKLKDDPKIYSRLDIIEKSALRGADLTKQLLGFARKGNYEKKVLNINHILEDSRRLLNSSIDKKITINSDLNPNIHLVSGDSNQLGQVFLNICINARDAMPHGGEIIIKTMNEEILDQNLTPKQYVHVSISDTGTGISPEVIDKIFDPFFTTKPIGKGSGLGLSMADGIIKNHGGFIKVESEAEKGTTFHIYLPMTNQEEISRSDEKISTYKPQLDGKSILLVDDEDVMRAVAYEFLQESHATIIQAKNGQEALEQYRQHKGKLAIILMDVMMPVMDGIHAYRAIKKIDPQMPIVLISGYAENNDDISELREKDSAYFIQKPYEKNNLLEIIHHIVHQNTLNS